jgi:peptide/nickel transport system ATP-binding protein
VSALVEVSGLTIGPAGAGPPVVTVPALQVEAGSVTALMGPSGAGKTTLLRALVGHMPDGLRRRSGEIRVLDRDVFNLAPAELRRLRRHDVALVNQDPGSCLNPRMTVRQLVTELACDGDDVAAALALVRLPGDAAFLTRRPVQISGGQQRRVALARALARHPELLLLDEPTAGLDPVLRDEIALLLRAIVAGGEVAIVLCCHDDRLVAQTADVVLEVGTPRPSAAAPARPAGPVAGSPGRSRTRLVARDLRVRVGRGRGARMILEGASLTVNQGQAVAIVGPSGAGKTTLARCLIGRQGASGAIELDGRPLAVTAGGRRRTERRLVQLVPQDPLGSLNPTRTVGDAVGRPLRLHRLASREAVTERVVELLEQVGLGEAFLSRRPAELSGGQRQRVAIARALAAGPAVLVCDEVTSALDAGTAAAVLATLARLRQDRQLAMVLVSHDLDMVAGHADSVVVLDGGRVVEAGDVASILTAPVHPVTRGLVHAGRPPARSDGS